MLQPALIFLAGALAASAYFLLKTRRNTPYLELDIDSLPPIEEGMATLAGLTSGNVYVGNTVEVFQNGPIFDAMERDIAAAKHTVHFETFVWSQGALEQRIVDLLARKAREGVKVRLLIDAIGGNERNEDRLKALRESGAQVFVYSQVTLFNWRRFNHRTHRKLLICDGVIGYTFGHGVSDLWLGDAHDSKHWRDTGIRITGPAVAGLQTVFMENWIEESHCVPAGEGCFPRLEHTGEIGMHVVSSASGDQVSAVALLYTVALACARREIIIQNPYFAPDDGMCELLATMVKRGVVVHLMVPGTHTDNPFVRRASFALYECLLEGGVRLYEYEHTLLHQKIVIIDGIWSHVGSTNFDSRSLALNEEVGVGFCDRGQAAELRAAFDADLRRSKEVTLQQWRRRPWPAKLVDRAVYQLHDQL